MATVKILKETPGKKAGSILDRVQSFEDVLNELGITTGQGLEITATAPALNPLLAFMGNEAKKTMVAHVLNEGWVPDWSDRNQAKWRPVFEYRAGSGFAFLASGCGNAYSRVGSRLYLKDKATSDHVGKYFADLWTEKDV